MQHIHDFLLIRGFECFSNYPIDFGGIATEYFHYENRNNKVTVIENVDNIQLLIYYEHEFHNYVAPKATEHVLNKLKEVLI